MGMLTKIKLGAVSIGLVGAGCIGSYVYGEHTANEQRLHELQAANEAQQEYIEQLKADNVKYEKFVTQVNNEVELVLFTEQGITNMVVEKGGNFLTHTKTEISIEYKVKLGIRTADISYHKGDKAINVVINRDDIEINSLEVINKNILLHNKKLFGAKMKDDEKIAAEKLIVEQVKEQVLSNKAYVDMAIDSFTDYMDGVADLVDVDINVIVH